MHLHYCHKVLHKYKMHLHYWHKVLLPSDTGILAQNVCIEITISESECGVLLLLTNPFPGAVCRALSSGPRGNLWPF